jgi:hypothetical protein
MKKQFFRLLIMILSINPSLIASAQQHELVKLWQTDSIFKVPESVLFDGNNTLYVSNIDGTDPWGKDGKGSVGKMNADGKNITVEWVTGLNAPKGMGLYNGKLYVADLSEVVVIDVASAKIDKRIAIPNAAGLNDISVGSDGVVYVSDSKNNQIYSIKNGVAEVYVTGMKGANGVLMRGKDFYFLDAGGIYKLNSDKTQTKIADGMDGGTDGVENIQGNDFIVSCWAGALWYVSGDGTKQLLKDTRAEKGNTADIGIDPKKKIIFVPTFWRNSVIAYQVK